MKEFYYISIDSSLFTNNHFDLVKNILTNHDKVIIFLLLKNEEQELSFEDQKNIVKCYFDEEELKSINLINGAIESEASLKELNNLVLTKERSNDDKVTIILDEDLKEAVERLESMPKNVNYAFYSHSSEQFNKVGINAQFSKNPIYRANLNDLMTYNLNLNAFNYILEHDLLFVGKFKEYVKGARLKHSISVGKLAYEIAEANNLENPYIFFLTGLFHDVGKQADGEKAEEIMQKYYKNELDLPKFAYHQYVGAYFTEKIFNISDEIVINAIKDHCTGNINMSPLAKIIYAADKIEPLRGYDSSDMIRAMKENYESGFLYVVKENLIYIENKSNLDLNEFDRVSKKFFKTYLNK